MKPAHGPVSAQLTGKYAEAAHRPGAAGPPWVGLETRRRVAVATRRTVVGQSWRYPAAGGK